MSSLSWFLCPWKKRCYMTSKGCAAYPVPFWVGCGSQLQTIMAVWRASNKKKSQTAISIFGGLPPLTITPSRIVFRVQEGPKSSKGTLRPDFQANTWPRLFFKKPMSHKKQERGCKEIHVQLAYHNLELMMSEHCKGRSVLWWIRKG
jgi:hypothetical protein